ncbi:histone H1-like [Pungitius pungitius]|uniref:histone H1-like n=1 Tax=Pungitius pungitius TaxID=134920 RepID=UPI002E0DE137
MSSAARVSLPPAPAKAPRKRAEPQKRKSGPTVSELILKAASASPERGSVSLAALKKALKAGGYDVVTNKARILTAIKRLVASESLVQTKGTGAAGSFRLNKKPSTPRKTALKKKKKKPKAKRVNMTSPRKTAGDDATPAAKKSPKKRSKSKSPAKSPKRAKRRTAKSTRTRAAAAAAKK